MEECRDRAKEAGTRGKEQTPSAANEKELYQELCQFSLFENVKRETIERLWQAGTVKEFPKGQVIMHAKTQVGQVYIQVTGKSMIYNLTHTGKRKIIFIFGSGALLNENISNFHAAAQFCETIEKSRIFVIPVADFMGCMEADFALTKAVLAA